MPQANLAPLPVQLNSPIDVNSEIIQYGQQDRANWFYACLQTPATFGVGPSAAVTTLGLYNPRVANVTQNNVNLVIRSCQWGLSADPAAAITLFYVKATQQLADPTAVTNIALGSGFGPIVTQYGINNAYAPVGKPVSAMTMNSTPFIVRVASDVLTTTAPQATIDDYLNGQIMLAPGDQFAMQASAAAAGYLSIVWEELPVW